MTSRFHRRTFLQRTAMASGALAAARFYPSPSILHAANAGDKLNCVVIGCGGRGKSHLSATASENLIAVVDPDEKRSAAAQAGYKGAGKVQIFADYRPKFDKLSKQIDAVFVATPNHQHAPPSLIAMQLGKGIYCEKPLCHDIGEARRLAETARRTKVPTQMGNQGHCSEGYRRLCEYIWAGAIGKVTETHSWTDRGNGGVGPRPPTEPVPAGMHWEEWIGPAPYRDYHKDLHPHEWHGWYDFGNGSLGNMGCHVLDGVCWALKLEHPVSIEVEDMAGGSDERYPTGTRIRWDFPARADLPALKAYWYDGHQGPPVPKGSKAKWGPRYLPPLLEELKKKYPEQKFDSNGTLYVGEKGILYTSTYGGTVALALAEKMKSVSESPGRFIVIVDPHDKGTTKIEKIPEPPLSLPRPKSSFGDFLRACREGKADTAAGFDYSTRLTEFTLLGNLAQHAGPGKKVEWDGPNMKVTNLTELNQWVTREYRQGWQV